MNPYTYQRGGFAPSEQGQAENAFEAAWSFVKTVFTSPLNSVTALAMVAFVATAVASLALVAKSEMETAIYLPDGKTAVQTTLKPQEGKVLGVAAYGYNQPICQRNTANCINYQLIGYDSNGWQVKIDYQLARNVIGAVKVNSWPFLDNISGSGSGYTGNDLQPGKTYNFILYKRTGNRLVKLTSLSITAPAKPLPPPCRAIDSPPASGCYYQYDQYGCYLNTVCPPAYGYQTVSLPIPNRSWREGWIEKASYESLREPGVVKVSGWAYDAGSSTNLAMQLRNADTGAVYSYSTREITPLFSSDRYDVAKYIGSKLGLDVGSVTGIYSFSVKFNSLPAGRYYIYNATYNGYLFNDYSIQPIIINQAAANPLTILSPAGSEQFPQGSNLVIKWSGDDPNYLIHLYLIPCTSASIGSCGNGLYNLGSNQPNSGSFTWRVQAADEHGKIIPEGYYQIWIEDNRGASDAKSNALIKIMPAPSAVPRVGQVINVNGTVSLVGEDGLYGFPSVAVFVSWGYSFSDVIEANSAERALSQAGVVPTRDYRYSNPLDQIRASKAVSPKLTYTADPATPAAKNIDPGAVDVEVLKEKLAATGEDVTLDSFSVYTESAYCGFTGLKLMDGSTQVGRTVTSMTKTSTSFCHATFADLNLKIPKDSSKVLSLKLSLPADAPKGTTFSFGVGGVGVRVTASGKYVDLVGSATFGNVMTITLAPTQAQPPVVSVTVPSANAAIAAGQNLDVGWTVSGANSTTLVGKTIIQLSWKVDNVYYEKFRVESTSVMNSSRTASFTVPQNLSAGHYKVVVNITYSDPNIGSNLSAHGEAPADLTYGTQPVACTTDAKLCPDGSYVSRDASNNCQFKACPTVPDCQTLWWHDSNTTACAQKSFCGSYMYQGLKTFSTESACKADLSPTATALTARYIKVSAPSSTSWIAWREIEIYGTSGSKITPVAATVSGTYSNSTFDRAYDGNVSTVWNSGSYANAYIILDLGADKVISKIKLLPASYPYTPTVTHSLSAKADSATAYTALKTFSNPTDNVWLEYVYQP